MRGRQVGARGDVAMVAGAIAWLALPLGSYDAVRVAALALVLVGAASARGPLGHLLAARPTVTLGEASYAVYMIHFPIVLVVARLHGAAGIATLPWLVQVSLYVMAVLATWALALAVSAGFERPARRRLRRLVDRWEGASNGRPG
jgi:peptidoglycan/LPS O-acetylase OafA/YrhL